jgi:hypothetical protein
MATEVKVCKKCNQTLSATMFYSSKNTKDGLRGKCKECTNQDNNGWYSKNKESVCRRTQEYKNERRDVIREKGIQYYRLNKSKYLANYSKRLHCKRKATPTWLTKAQTEAISNYYWLANDLYAISGEKYHVDHIVPIQGKNVCGLHVPWNLQILPSDINISKSNRC